MKSSQVEFSRAVRENRMNLGLSRKANEVFTRCQPLKYGRFSKLYTVYEWQNHIFCQSTDGRIFRPTEDDLVELG